MSKILTSRPSQAALDLLAKMDAAAANDAVYEDGCEESDESYAKLNAQLAIARMNAKLEPFLWNLVFESVDTVEQRLKDFLAGNTELHDYAVLITDRGEDTLVDFALQFMPDQNFIYTCARYTRGVVFLKDSVDVELPLDGV